jgi:hypothetical protein
MYIMKPFRPSKLNSTPGAFAAAEAVRHTIDTPLGMCAFGPE